MIYSMPLSSYNTVPSVQTSSCPHAWMVMWICGYSIHVFIICGYGDVDGYDIIYMVVLLRLIMYNILTTEK